uniref:Chitin-binding type-2 domain-containing protein n=1 Tax=Glossina austeni TaxID=7395 RepID=A0A1A9V571_GLOAU
MQFNALNMINGIGLWLVVAGCLSVVESAFVCPVQQADDSFAMLYPSPTNCSEFYECVRGEALLYACPVDLHFNTRRKRAVLTNVNANLIGCVVKIVETVKAMAYHNKHSNLLMLAKLNSFMSSYYCNYQLTHY